MKNTMMRKFFALSVLLFLPLFVQAKGIDVGSSFPALKKEVASMKATDGKNYTIEQIIGKKGTLVIFTCNHCPYAVKWQDRIAKLGNEYKKKGFGVIAINSNDPESNPMDNFEGMVERAKLLKLEFPYVVDSTSSVAKAYGAQKTPEIFLFNTAGKLVYKGAVDDHYDQTKVEKHWLKAALDNLIAGKKIDPSSTKAVGCGIKWRKNG